MYLSSALCAELDSFQILEMKMHNYSTHHFRLLWSQNSAKCSVTYDGEPLANFTPYHLASDHMKEQDQNSL